MSDAPDPLEAELAILRPRDPSPQLRRRVAARLAPRRWWLAALGLFALVGLAAALLFNGGEEQATQTERSASAPPEPAANDPAPTLQAYRRAWMRSPEDLDHLLDRQAARMGGSTTRIYAFRPSDAFLIGEP